MWTRDFTQTRSRIALLIGQCIVLIMCIAYIEYIYTANILPDKEAKESYRQVDCVLISKQLSTRGHLIHTYRADFLVSYNVGGVQYNRWVSGNGLDASFTQNEQEQEDILSQYEIGGTYPCWYNPTNPQLSILVLRHNWLSTFPLLVPSVVATIMLYYILKNLFQIIGTATVKTREIVRERKKHKKK